MRQESLQDRVSRIQRSLSQQLNASRLSLESLNSSQLTAPSTPISREAAEEHIGVTAAAVHQIVDNYLDGQARLHDLVDKAEKDGLAGLPLFNGDPGKLAAHPEAVSGLEAIIQADGTRPSFLIKDGRVDKASSPLGDWDTVLSVDSNLLEDAIACVGRINNPGLSKQFAGTGFLVHNNLLLTNRHVLQAIADKADDEWIFRPNVSVDFGYEYRGIASQNARQPRTVLFCGRSRINTLLVDHAKLDLALIELEPVPLENLPRRVLSIGATAGWRTERQRVYIIGYPGSQEEGAYPPTLLEQLFQQTFGYKRLAPGIASKSRLTTEAWTAGHDCTTLAGNSGSVVLQCGQPGIALALHYGGIQADENWAHVLGAVLEYREKSQSPSLLELLRHHGVTLVS